MKVALILAAVVAAVLAGGREDALKMIKSNKVAIFGRSSCGLTRATDKLLTDAGIDHLYYKYDLESDGQTVSRALWGIGGISGRITLPFSFVCGEYVGSYFDVKKTIDQIKKDIESPNCQKEMDALN